METIREHTHAERRRVAERLVPLIRKRFGENLVALATCASFARGDDGPYSDLELVAFLERFDDPRGWGGWGGLVNGLLVEVVWMTGERYRERTKGVTREWYLAGADRLEPLVNAPFVEALDEYAAPDLEADCARQAEDHWTEVQESTCKVLNAVRTGNREGVGLVGFDMLHRMMIQLALLNARPFTTFVRMIEQSRTLPVRPAAFERLADLFVAGRHTDLERLDALARETYDQLESLMRERGLLRQFGTIEAAFPVEG